MNAPTLRDIQNMDDRELVRIMLARQSCPHCAQSSGLEPLTDTIHETLNDPAKGIRRIVCTIHCASCGTLKTPFAVTVPLNEEAYKAMFSFGEKMKNWRPSANVTAQAQKIRKRIMIDPTKPWYPGGQS